jgi:hypothetical protein
VQITLFCVALAIMPGESRAAPNGGSARGYLADFASWAARLWVNA